MITFQPFTASDFVQFQQWIVSEKLLIQFAGSIFSYPLTDNQLYSYLDNPKLQPLKVLFDGKYVGHCELNFSNKFPRLSRILIGDETLRGKGLGKEIVTNMLELIFQDKQVNKVDLNVFEWNTQAIQCYERIGFYFNPCECTEYVVNGEKSKCVNMLIEKHIFYKNKNIISSS